MLDLAIGSTWRNRCGQFVTVEYKASQRAWYVRFEADNEMPGYIVDSRGHPTRRSRADLSLMERATRVYISIPEGTPAKVAQDATEMYRKRGCWVVGTMEDQRDSLRALLTCEMIVMLPSFTLDTKCVLDLVVAKDLGMGVTWQEEVDAIPEGARKITCACQPGSTCYQDKNGRVACDDDADKI